MEPNLIKADSAELKKNVLYISLTQFYNEKENMEKLLDILENKSKMSLRIIDWFVTNYSKKNNIVYNIKKNNIRTNKIERVEQFIVYLRYKGQLKAFSKKRFDPFCRNNRIIEWGPNKNITTTIGQLNFFRWAIQNNIIEYIKENLKEIETDMNSNIRKHYEKKSKKKTKKKEDNGIEKKVYHISVKSNKKKRRELSSCATKTMNKVKPQISIIIDFD